MHLRIPKSDKQEIASKLLQGVKIEDILLSFKEDGSSKQIERKHLIKRRDILNISKKYNVNIILPKVRQSLSIKKNEDVSQKTVDLPINDSSINTIETKKKHVIASQLPLSFVHPIYENVWRISMSNNLVSSNSNNYNGDVYVTKIGLKCCSDDCIAYCDCCNICYHSYSCTCSDFFFKKVICEHVHLVVLFQVTPQTYQFEENIEKPLYDNQDHSTYTRHFTESACSSQPIESIHVSEDLRENNDYNLCNEQNFKLENFKKRLEKLMMEISHKVSECNNCDLLENIERQMTDIACTLNTEKRNEVQTIIKPEKNIEVYYVF